MNYAKQQYSPERLSERLREGFGTNGLKYSQHFIAAVTGYAIGETTVKGYFSGTNKEAPRIDILLLLCSKEVHAPMPDKVPASAGKTSKAANQRVRAKFSEFPVDEDGYHIIPMLDCDLGWLLGWHDTKRKESADFKAITGLSENTFRTLVQEQDRIEELASRYSFDDLTFPRISFFIDWLVNYPDHEELVKQFYAMLNDVLDMEPNYRYSERFKELIELVRLHAQDQLFGFEGTAYDYVTGQLYEMFGDAEANDLDEQQQYIVKMLTKESSIPPNAIDQTGNQDIVRKYAKVIVDDIYAQEEHRLKATLAKYEATKLFERFLDSCTGEKTR